MQWFSNLSSLIPDADFGFGKQANGKKTICLLEQGCSSNGHSNGRMIAATPMFNESLHNASDSRFQVLVIDAARLNKSNDVIFDACLECTGAPALFSGDYIVSIPYVKEKDSQSEAQLKILQISSGKVTTLPFVPFVEHNPVFGGPYRFVPMTVQADKVRHPPTYMFKLPCGSNSLMFNPSCYSCII
jgi:hypothetical protein